MKQFCLTGLPFRYLSSICSFSWLHDPLTSYQSARTNHRPYCSQPIAIRLRWKIINKASQFSWPIGLKNKLFIYLSVTSRNTLFVDKMPTTHIALIFRCQSHFHSIEVSDNWDWISYSSQLNSTGDYSQNSMRMRVFISAIVLLFFCHFPCFPAVKLIRRKRIHVSNSMNWNAVLYIWIRRCCPSTQ